MFKIGDKVSVIHEQISGTISSIKGKRLTIIDEHGFSRDFMDKEVVLLKSEREYKLTDEIIERVISEQLQEKNTKLKPKKGVAKVHQQQESFEIDLHIEKLIDDNYYTEDTLTIQMRYCRIFMERALRLKVKKAMVIHGKGEGVLKQEIHKYLEHLENRKHIGIDYKVVNQGGATEVYFKVV